MQFHTVSYAAASKKTRLKVLPQVHDLIRSNSGEVGQLNNTESNTRISMFTARC